MDIFCECNLIILVTVQAQTYLQKQPSVKGHEPPNFCGSPYVEDIAGRLDVNDNLFWLSPESGLCSRFARSIEPWIEMALCGFCKDGMHQQLVNKIKTR